MNTAERFLRLSRTRLFGTIGYSLLKAIGIEFPRSVKIGQGVRLPHWAVGLVVHGKTVLGDRVTLYQGVTLGRADLYRPDSSNANEGIEIGDDVRICAGAKILFKSGKKLTIGNGAIIGANSVVLTSVGDNEVWAGSPARFIKATGIGQL
ncbi:DapH/DapD/GlmU-related protein [Luteimonas sp. RC10]|uniref:DapH/DapD/GlmU-related protein n=1 Tax=Luteimonas sp. RC10 TaxID=2587035 RepID=UPI00161AFB7E|nr:DapH/DapD/GlmU-related protein [Luteimonas sp. RC10]MBB3344865.1 serine O-acetyltransferase [Luteimonas sp. RC10]